MASIAPRTKVPAGLVAAALAALAFASYPAGGHAAIAAFLAVVLVAIAVIDIASFRIPNWIVLPSTAIVLVANIALSPARAPEFVLATLITGVALLLPNLINGAWIGMGDVKLGMLLGAALGWGVVGALELAFISVLPFALIVRLRSGAGAGAGAGAGRAAGRGAVLPFGPFMAFGALAVVIVPRLLGYGA